MNVVKEINKINQLELELGVSGASWHDEYRDSAYIFVGGIPFDLTEGDVITIFSQYGEVMDLNMPRDKETGKRRGFAFLMYEDQRSTVLAVDNLNGAVVLEKTLRVDHVKDYKQPKTKGADGEWLEPDEQSLNARPEMIVDSASNANNSDSDSDSDAPSIDPEDPMREYLLAQRREARLLKKSSSKSKSKSKKDKHKDETPEERRARKARKAERRARKGDKSEKGKDKKTSKSKTSEGMRGVEALLSSLGGGGGGDVRRAGGRSRSRSRSPPPPSRRTGARSRSRSRSPRRSRSRSPPPPPRRDRDVGHDARMPPPPPPPGRDRDVDRDRQRPERGFDSRAGVGRGDGRGGGGEGDRRGRRNDSSERREFADGTWERDRH
ncbi:hypothetical protein B0H16DRAFT_1886150 [Mycena metata]|uniref:RRM domain-containing protein n=1 Tax=Mycena metata TaxID=1033252 RepID=A0AAD7J383_9AGAR|nr:hypothetical protein B0H16DRAFT_1886150 [Mycena metata]